VTSALSREETDLLAHHLREAYMEIFPAPGIIERLDVLEPNAYVAVTCSPTKGVDETLALTERLVEKGFRVVPHIAARSVADDRHLARIVTRLNAIGIESVFVPGGDRDKPLGDFATALDLLRALADTDHGFSEIGIAAHPEGHPSVDDETLLAALREKSTFATYLVTQMCFDARLLERWLTTIRDRGVMLPAWIGLPGALDRAHLIRTSLRIGVGDSLRFLKKQGAVAAKLLASSTYRPDTLVHDLAAVQARKEAGIAGYHLFCLNQVAKTEQWRHDAIEALR